MNLTIVIDDADISPQMREVLGFLADQGTAKAACLLSNLEGLEASGMDYSQMLRRLLALEESLFMEHVAVLASGLEKSMPQPLLNVQ